MNEFRPDLWHPELHLTRFGGTVEGMADSAPTPHPLAAPSPAALKGRGAVCHDVEGALGKEPHDGNVWTVHGAGPQGAAEARYLPCQPPPVHRGTETP